MATPGPISAPLSARIDATGAPWINLKSAPIVHVGQSAVVLGRGESGALIVLTSPSAGLMPGGIQFVTDREFATARREISASTGVVSLAHWNVPTVTRADLTALPVGIHPDASRVLRAGIARSRNDTGIMSPEPARIAGNRLAAGSRTTEIRDALFSLIGAGPGTTPSGDDVVVGVLAGLLATGRDASFRAIVAELPALLDRTTRASRHYLAAAAQRRFADHVLELLESLGDPAALQSAVDRAAGWGATSGLDLASGILSTLRHSLSHTLGSDSIIERAA